ncbi:putative WPP domain interacting protein 1 [Hibiscus syriacus]|uniref:WPP domain interacting protein 1 n=1 Tax=Hibiscus syriacus TaxID=106335 RepID=A0A6A3C6Q5_HIBSY|nr:putative WPP domain interacting protein 1 [Hibiscus syriacus]
MEMMAFQDLQQIVKQSLGSAFVFELEIINGVVSLQLSVLGVPAVVRLCFRLAVAVYITEGHNPETQENLCSQSDDIPSSSYTPPSDLYEYSDDPSDPKLKFVTCFRSQILVHASLSRFRCLEFPSRKLPFLRHLTPSSGAVMFSSASMVNPNLGRFCKWLKSELELQGIACFVADRAKYSDTQSHEIADRIICSVTYGVVVVASCSFLNHRSLEEIRFFAQKKNLIPLFFDTGPAEITGLLDCNSLDKECKEAIEGQCYEQSLGGSVADRDFVGEGFEELPFPRNRVFVGREKEIVEIESALFGVAEQDHCCSMMPVIKGEASGQSEGLADEEIIGRSSMKRSKFKKSKSGNYKSLGSGVICVNGVPGIGKTELVLEFAYRYAQRYKMVLWVDEKERGRIRSFEDQELEAFKRVKRELFRDMPYLLIIDNLETERDWWEGKDLHDLIPRNTGGTHVIITTRLPKLPISPSALFEAVNQVSTSLEDVSTSSAGEQFFKHNPFLMKIICFCFAVLHQVNCRRNGILASRMLLVGAWFAPSLISANLLATAAKYMPVGGNRFKRWTNCLSLTFSCCGGCGLANQIPPYNSRVCQEKECLSAAKATVLGIRKIGNPLLNSDHLWATAFLVFGFKSEPPVVQLKAIDMVTYIKKTALPLAIRAFTTFSRCNSALELLKVCTNVLEEVEKSFVSQIQDWCQGPLCWRNKLQGKQRVDEYMARRDIVEGHPAGNQSQAAIERRPFQQRRRAVPHLY